MENISININEEIELSLEKLSTLLDDKGSILSSHTGHYKSVCIRDNLLVSYAFEAAGKMDLSIKIMENLFAIFSDYHELFSSVVSLEDPLDAEKYMPGRFSPNDHKELKQESFHLHFDFPALFLFRIAQLQMQGYNLVDTKENEELLQAIVSYIDVLDWPSSLEYGIWEEGPEVHTSTLACVIAAFDLLPKAFSFITINKKLLNYGKKKFYKTIPLESLTRPCDLALLASYWPLAICSKEDALKILGAVEKSLVKRRGMIRYSGDSYYNTRPDSPRGTEPRWPLGLAWISIVHFTLLPLLEGTEQNEEEAQSSEKTGENLTVDSSTKKAFEYLEKLTGLKTVNGGLPELISSGDPNIHSPFAITEAMYLSALCSAKDNIENKEKQELE